MPNPIFGNYHGYYTKRPSLRDPRIALLPPTFFTGKTVLDVGCNEGWVTCEIAHTWGAHRVVGVDIDDTLVRAAWKRRRTLWSLQPPPPPHHVDRSPSPKRVRLDADAEPEQHLVADYFPISCPHSHGPLPIPAPTSNSDHRDVFPHNVTFQTTDWVTEDTTRDEPVYDVVIAFSITKWVHLHHGDQGLTTLFQRAHRVLKPGGALIVEPQAWETYGKARRMDPRLRENARHLQLRPHEFPALLEKLGFGPPKHLGTAGEGGFHRPVDLYVKK
ncbi:Bicoid-interacting protein 3-domain-containing protein [Boletus edulis BED1]|uniref:RNA methyltransferase n=1 Tax=Boletus edulis BED1 TaxID=1328754 RepID=A0AAD4BM70_BOLED|nr:Bicoid-interacting protein 3-domain-containing protein [Boletus edulis BED1]